MTCIPNPVARAAGLVHIATTLGARHGPRHRKCALTPHQTAASIVACESTTDRNVRIHCTHKDNIRVCLDQVALTKIVQKHKSE